MPDIKNQLGQLGPCAKQTTIAIIVNGGRYWVASNACWFPVDVCPRGDLPTGEGYEMCQNICCQDNHAEAAACFLAGDGARGGTLYLIGHTYVCRSCQAIMDRYGIAKVVIVG